MDRTALDAWRALLTVHAEIVPRLAAELEDEAGLPLTWYDVLLHLYEADGHRLRMHQLAASRLLSRSATTRFIDRMEDAGLVARVAAPDDGRGVEVSLTAEGERALRAAAPVHLAGIRRYFATHLTSEQAAAVAGALTAVADAVRRE